MSVRQDRGGEILVQSSGEPGPQTTRLVDLGRFLPLLPFLLERYATPSPEMSLHCVPGIGPGPFRLPWGERWVWSLSPAVAETGRRLPLQARRLSTASAWTRHFDFRVVTKRATKVVTFLSWGGGWQKQQRNGKLLVLLRWRLFGSEGGPEPTAGVMALTEILPLSRCCSFSSQSEMCPFPGSEVSLLPLRCFHFLCRASETPQKKTTTTVCHFPLLTGVLPGHLPVLARAVC